MNRFIRILSALAAAGLLLLAGCPSDHPDAYEPNETIADFFDLGTVAGSPTESSWIGTISPEGDGDFYGMTAEDPDTLQVPGTPEHFTLTVRMIPPQSPDARNYDLYLYDEAGTEVDSSTNTGSAEETITVTWHGTVGPDESADFRVEVRGAGGDSSSSPYTLYASLEESSP
jgi:hypothetical protein